MVSVQTARILEKVDGAFTRGWHMQRSGRTQKDKVTQFRSITGASEKIANDCLKQTGWSVEAAIEVFYSGGYASASPAVDTNKIERLFLQYKDSDSNDILSEGIAQFCQDLGVDPSDIVMLVISWYMNAAVMCKFTRDEWVNGWVKMGVDSIDKLRAKLPELRADLRDANKWRDIYTYAYMWSREEGQKCVQLDVALAMWQLLLSGERGWEYLEDWMAFLQDKHKGRAISRDTWVQLFEFIRLVKPDFSNFDEAAAWPYLLDEFVEVMKEKKGMS